VKFECDFADPDNRRHQLTIPVELSTDEVKAIRALRRDGDPHVEVKIKAYALRHAYAIAPSGFLHIQGGIRQLMVN
jgi:hypothetical protein